MQSAPIVLCKNYLKSTYLQTGSRYLKSFSELTKSNSFRVFRTLGCYYYFLLLFQYSEKLKVFRQNCCHFPDFPKKSLDHSLSFQQSFSLLNSVGLMVILPNQQSNNFFVKLLFNPKIWLSAYKIGSDIARLLAFIKIYFLRKLSYNLQYHHNVNLIFVCISRKINVLEF